MVRDIEESDWDVITQCPEERDWAAEQPALFGDIDLASFGIVLNTPNGYNTGVVGFRDIKAKNEFITNYIKAARYLTKVKQPVLDSHIIYTPDLVLEQQHLLQVCKRRGCDVKTLISSNDDNAKAVEIGYQHVLASSKFKMLGKVQQTLKKVDFQLYNKLNRLCPL